MKIQYTQGTPIPPLIKEVVITLTFREAQILRMLAGSYSNSILTKYCNENGLKIDCAEVDNLIYSIANQDELKTWSRIFKTCN